MTYLTREALAEELKCSTRTVDNLRARGMPSIPTPIGPLRMGVRFNLTACRKWLEANRQAQAQAVLDTTVQVANKINRRREEP